MLDVQLLRSDVDAVADRLAVRSGYRLDVKTFAALEKRCRRSSTHCPNRSARQNATRTSKLQSR